MKTIKPVVVFREGSKNVRGKNVLEKMLVLPFKTKAEAKLSQPKT